jgi:chromosome transmission fidelity protein 18
VRFAASVQEATPGAGHWQPWLLTSFGMDRPVSLFDTAAARFEPPSLADFMELDDSSAEAAVVVAAKGGIERNFDGLPPLSSPLEAAPSVGSFWTVRNLQGETRCIARQPACALFPGNAADRQPHSPSNRLDFYRTIDRVEAALQSESLHRQSGSRIPLHQATASGLLLASKYSPSRFTELLSGDAANIAVLQWLKEWQTQLQGKRETLAGSCALQPLCLLAGSPGTGKTTMARIVGAMCGFNVVEINASDDLRRQDDDAMRLRLKDALSSSSVANGKRNLLVVDEIDGSVAAEGGISAFLLKFLAADSAEAESGAPVRKKGLQVPVICICNDLNAAPLRLLRKSARIVSLRKISASKLAGRLAAICAKEGVKFDLQALMNIAEYTECDIRASLNALQFIASRECRVTMESLGRNLVCLKDFCCKSPVSLLQEIFKTPSPRMKIYCGALESEKFGRNGAAPDALGVGKKYAKMLADSVGNNPEAQGRIFDGCVEYYLHCTNSNFDLERISRIGEFNLLIDAMGCEKSSSGDGGSFYLGRQYFPYLVLAYHYLFGSTQGMAIAKMPSAEFTTFTRMAENFAVLHEFCAFLPKWRMQKQEARLWLLPYLNLMVQPQFDTVKIS